MSDAPPRSRFDDIGRSGARPARPEGPRGDAMSEREFSADCDLCEAARITEWFHEDDVCWIAECEICAVPMVVWRGHGINPPAEELSHMHDQLAGVVERHFEFEHYVDDNM